MIVYLFQKNRNYHVCSEDIRHELGNLEMTNDCMTKIYCLKQSELIFFFFLFFNVYKSIKEII